MSYAFKPRPFFLTRSGMAARITKYKDTCTHRHQSANLDMLYVECPEKFPAKGRYQKQCFLAGGITNCPDWQSEVVQALSPIPDIAVFSPRRKHFDADKIDPAEQIRWEIKAIARCPVVAFWFPGTSICPITLFELGRLIGQYDKILIIGADAKYTRLLDLKIQTKILRPGLAVYEKFSEFLHEVKKTLLVDAYSGYTVRLCIDDIEHVKGVYSTKEEADQTFDHLRLNDEIMMKGYTGSLSRSWPHLQKQRKALHEDISD